MQCGSQETPERKLMCHLLLNAMLAVVSAATAATSQQVAPLRASVLEDGGLQLTSGLSPVQAIATPVESAAMLEQLLEAACSDAPDALGARVILLSALLSGPALDNPLRQCRLLELGDDLQSLRGVLNSKLAPSPCVLAVATCGLADMRGDSVVESRLLARSGARWAMDGRSAAIVGDVLAVGSATKGQSMATRFATGSANTVMGATRRALWQAASDVLDVHGPNASPALMAQLQILQEAPLLVAWELRRKLGRCSISAVSLIATETGVRLLLTSASPISEWSTSLAKLGFQARLDGSICFATRGTLVVECRGPGEVEPNGKKTTTEVELATWGSTFRADSRQGLMWQALAASMQEGSVGGIVASWIDEAKSVTQTDGRYRDLPGSPATWLGRLAARALMSAVR